MHVPIMRHLIYILIGPVANETRNVNKMVHGSFNCDSDKELSTELADFDYGG